MTLGNARLCVSIVNYRTPRHTIECLQSLIPERASVPDLRVIVADGASGDDSVTTIGNWIAAEGHGDWIKLLPLSRNGGFGWAHNQIVIHALQGETPPDYFYLLNPDAIVLPGSLRASIDEMEADPRRGVTGGLMYNMEQELQISAHRFADWRTELAAGARMPRLSQLLGFRAIGLPQGDQPREVDWVSGSNLIVRAQALKEVGLFDDGFFLYYEEIELMWRIKKGGWTIWQTPRAGITHEGGAATNVSRDPAVRRRKPLPAYWYQSERRFLTLTRGRLGARLAFIGWVLARLFIGLPRWLISPRVRAGSIFHDARNKIKAWLEPVARASEPHIAHWTDAPERPPAWEAWR